MNLLALDRKQNHAGIIDRKPFIVGSSLGRKQKIADSLGGSQIWRRVSAGSENWRTSYYPVGTKMAVWPLSGVFDNSTVFVWYSTDETLYKYVKVHACIVMFSPFFKGRHHLWLPVRFLFAFFDKETLQKGIYFLRKKIQEGTLRCECLR